LLCHPLQKHFDSFNTTEAGNYFMEITSAWQPQKPSGKFSDWRAFALER
jgi:hypothetical protein